MCRLRWRPSGLGTVSLAGDDAAKVMRLIDALDDNDDVQKVYADHEISEEELAAM